ncbi:MAG: hypothetical protein MZV64_01475 [Ignavibacteriales bacterium]|nr:hypothetical protein [Ignavibacteriales bacterium]
MGEYIISDYYWMGHNWNCQVADDFIATGNWAIDQIIVFGSYSDCLAEGFNIYFYTNKENKPDSLVYFAGNQAFSNNLINNSGLFTITLESPAELMTGHYWISVQANY